MKQVTREKFDGISYEHVAGATVAIYQTRRFTFIVPRNVELAHRYLRMYYPACKYLLEWDPYHKHSFGWWIEFEAGKMTLKSRMAHYMSGNDVTITYDVSTRKLHKLALTSIAQVMTHCIENKGAV